MSIDKLLIPRLGEWHIRVKAHLRGEKDIADMRYDLLPYSTKSAYLVRFQYAA